MQPQMKIDDAERVSRVIFHYGGRIWREKDKAAQLTVIADMTRDLVGADRCSIWLKDATSGELYTRVAHGLKEVRLGAGQSIVRTCVETGEASVVNNASEDARFSGEVDRTSGYQTKSILTVPMRGTGGDVIGACQVLNKPDGFVPSDVDLVCLAASFSAEAIENLELQRVRESARRMQTEIEIAREVQTNMLPKTVPEQIGVECAGLCKPALRVGGDYYNFWSLPSGAFAVALGDVSGKGIPAALLMASIQASLHGLLNQHEGEAGETAAALSRVVYEVSSAERYSTLFFARYDAASRSLTYVNAGQVAPILWRASASPNDRITRLESCGPPIGLLRGTEYQEKTVPFEPGDCLVCFSDGISESMNEAGEEWGEDNVLLEMPLATRMSAQSFVTYLAEAAEAFAAGAPQHDDMTALMLRVS